MIPRQSSHLCASLYKDGTVEENRVSATTTAASGTADPTSGAIGIVDKATISDTRALATK